MKKKRIVVTGMGLVSCFGQDVNVFYDKLLAGESGTKEISCFPCADFPTRIAVECPHFNAEDYLDKKQARRVDRYIAFTLAAGKMALQHAGLTQEVLQKVDTTRAGCVIGSGIGGIGTLANNVQILLEKGPKRITPFLIPYILTNMGSGILAMEVGFQGPNYSISTACATANNCIISAASHIEQGDADLMICGGVEAPLTPIALAGFCAAGALSERNDAPKLASRPWDKERDGFVMAEGAGILVLESLEHAVRRGAKIYAEYLGGGLSCDAHHLTEPRPDGGGVTLCIRNALAHAGKTAEEVDYINAHATSTPAGDMCEVRALEEIFAHPEKVKMGATKSMIGHALGAAGGLEAIAVVKAIETGLIHPTINLTSPEAMRFDVPTTCERHRVNVAISNSFGFGGHNSTIVIGRF